MKKHISPYVRTFSTRLSSFVLLAACFGSLLLPVSARAQEEEPAKPRVSVQDAGLIGGLPVFDVYVDQTGGEPLELTISDEAGVVLYSTRIRSGSFSKRFQVEDLGVEDMKLVLRLNSRKSKEAQAYLISSRVSQVQDVVVSRL
ncbi:hypothetical protein [Flaviaesturariibacter amylovorans]|uniref:Uncharacterized protein n=1 Tax=Flaviaesturariibacter amylovorans TaxID=1084520 RepID=A0ABP8H7Y6_9BACT